MSATPDTTTAPAPRKRRPPRRVEVTAVKVLSPAMRRITFKGAELEGFAPEAPASYIKLIFPEPGQLEPDRPLPDAPRPKSMRTYTPLAVRPEAHEVDVDFVLHGEGPASTWAAQAKVGQVIFLMGPGPGYALDKTAARHLLIADDSALPAVENILAELPSGAHVQLLVEVISADEEASGCVLACKIYPQSDLRVEVVGKMARAIVAKKSMSFDFRFATATAINQPDEEK